MTAVTAGSHRKPRTAPARAISRPAGAPLRIRRLGYLVLGLQVAGFLAWSAILYSRYALTIDFAEYQQAWYLIAHGVMDPANSVGAGAFWQNHSEFIMWPLALLYWVWPHQVTLLWIQDLAVAAAEFAAFSWLCEIARRHLPDRDAVVLSAAGLVLLAANPWIWWSVSFDFHTEALAIAFTVLLARDLANNRRRAWLWLLPLLACGDVADTYLVGLGLAVMLAARGARLRGAILLGIGLAATGFITLVHGNLGSVGALHSYSYLAGAGATASLSTPALAAGIASHPLGVLRELWSRRADVWASIAPSGALGIGFVWVLPVTLVVLLENELGAGLLFAMPSFQSLALYILVPVGTIWALAHLARRHRRTALALTSLLVAQAIGWAVIWAPQTPGRWLKVSPAAAATLAAVNARIPASATVVASEGVVGRYSSRTHLGALEPPSVTIHGPTWFVVAPQVGIEVQSLASSMALIAELAGPLHATVITHRNGVWAFRWVPPHGTSTLAVPAVPVSLPVWASPGAAGRAVMTGPEQAWHVTASGQRGYVSDGLEWLKQTGNYLASVDLSSTGPVNVEVWNDTGDVLLSRRSVPAAARTTTVQIPVAATTAYQPGQYAGWGPFRADFLPPPPGQRLEIRVWSPGGETVHVYRASLTAAGGG
jgi:Predicted membrane protein (DUF2079)